MDLGEPIEEIKLTKEEAKTLKQVVFRNHFIALEPAYRKIADKEVNAVQRIVKRNIEYDLQEFGSAK